LKKKKKIPSACKKSPYASISHETGLIS